MMKRNGTAQEKAVEEPGCSRRVFSCRTWLVALTLLVFPGKLLGTDLPPAIVRTTPRSGERNAPRNTPVTFYFDRPLGLVWPLPCVEWRVTDSLDQVLEEFNPDLFTCRLDSSGTAFTCIYGGLLPASAHVYARLLDCFADTNGNYLDHNDGGRFLDFVVGTTIAKDPPPIVLTNLTWSANEPLEFRFSTQPGVTYTVVETAVILPVSTWTPLLSSNAIGSGITVRVPILSSSAAKFYRVFRD